MSIYNIVFSETAAKVRDSLPDDRQDTLATGLQAVARDPYTKVSSSVGGDEQARSIALTRSLAVDYVVNDGFLFVLVIHIVDTEHVLLDD